MTSARNYLSGLDALRGVAAFAVLILHGCYHFRLPHLMRHGYLAVDFFFMLSGFVLAHAYEERLLAGLRFGSFMRGRVIRLYPMVVLGVVAGIAGESLGSSVWQGTAIKAAAALALVPSLINASAQAFPIDPPLWSLLWEVVASAALATALYGLATRKLALCAAVSFAWLAYIAYRHGGVEIGYTVGHLTDGAARVGFGFTAGMILQRWWARNGRDIPSMSIGWLAAALTAIFCMPELPGYWMVDLAMIGLAFPLIILGGAGVTHVSRPWRSEADMSYPLYLVHLPVLTIIVTCSGAHTIVERKVWMIIGTAIALLFAYLAFDLWDRPVRLWLSALPSRTSKGNLDHDERGADAIEFRGYASGTLQSL